MFFWLTPGAQRSISYKADMLGGDRNLCEVILLLFEIFIILVFFLVVEIVLVPFVAHFCINQLFFATGSVIACTEIRVIHKFNMLMVSGKRFTYLWRSVFIVPFVTRHLVKQAQTRLLWGGVRGFLFCQAVSQSRVLFCLLLYIFSLTDFFMDTFP